MLRPVNRNIFSLVPEVLGRRQNLSQSLIFKCFAFKLTASPDSRQVLFGRLGSSPHNFPGTQIAFYSRNSVDSRDSRNLVLPIDNSEDSEFTISWTLDHIYRRGDNIHLLHCIPLEGAIIKASSGAERSALLVDAPRQQDAETLRQKWDTLNALRERYAAKFVQRRVPKSDVVYDILQEKVPPVNVGLFEALELAPDGEEQPQEHGEPTGMIGEIILAKAEELDAAAVVMASHNKGPIREFLTGSITNFCIHHCAQPVVVLHNVPKPEQDARAVWMSGPRQLAVAVDDSKHSEDALQWTLGNVYREGDVLHVLHAVRGSGAPGETDSDGVSEKFDRMLQAAGVTRQIDIITGCSTESAKSLGLSIIERSRGIGASLLVMAGRAKNPVEEFFLGSVPGYVTHHCSDIPVAVLHP
mmetsp:Transcript_40763/g.96942  ORF Transcript_40763/g.96942 Transcript_40763/m.96942 type:complete len:413 (-) Transcript_40763:143-1381(-)